MSSCTLFPNIFLHSTGISVSVKIPPRIEISFCHSEQSVRIVEILEKEGRGLKATGEESAKENRETMFFPIYINEKNLTISIDKKEGYTYELYYTIIC